MTRLKHTPEWVALAQCIGKHRFDDAGLARKVATQFSRRHDTQGSAYRCRCCGGWHVGQASKPQKKRRGKDKRNHYLD